MGYPLEGIQAQITSVTALTDLSTMLDPSTGAIGANSVTINVSAPQLNTTAQGNTSLARKPGLKTWSATVQALYTRATKYLGNKSNVSLSAGTLYWVKGYQLSIATAGVLDISNTTQADDDWAYFMPSRLVGATGTIDCLSESSAGPIEPLDPDGAAPTATFAFRDESTDPSIACSVNLSVLDVGMPIGEPQNQTTRYSFESTGNLTAVSGTSSPCIFPAGTIDGPDWDTDGSGTPDVSIVFTAASGRTYTGTCFWRQVDISMVQDQLAAVTVQLQGAGPLAIG